MKRTSYRSAAAESHLDQPGFTLVELLVVIGIIAVLIGVLLPVLGKARQSGNRLKCMANLRSLGQAVAIYTNYNKGSLPIGLVNDGNDIDASPYTYHGEGCDWTTLLVAIMSRQQGNGYGSQQLVTDSTAQIRATFICPDVSFSLAGSGFITQYSCHPRLMPDLSMQDNYRNRTIGGGGPKGHYLVPYKITQVKRSSEAGLLADGVVSNNGYYAHATMNGLDASNITYFKGPWLTSDISFNPANQLGTSIDMVPTRTPPSNYTDANLDTDNNSGQIRFRHINNTQTNLLMVDGHVESFTYNKFTHQTDLFRKYVYVTPNM